jgi:hypothetical protein
LVESGETVRIDAAIGSWQIRSDQGRISASPASSDLQIRISVLALPILNHG